MTGIPPFTDETPEAVFDNILSMRMEWPEDEGEVLSDSAVEAIKGMKISKQSYKISSNDKVPFIFLRSLCFVGRGHFSDVSHLHNRDRTKALNVCLFYHRFGPAF